jgi:chemotaxis protein methyltransferase CheR
VARNPTGAATALVIPAIPDDEREFAFSDADFRNLSQLAYQHAGIVLAETKRNLVYSRLSRRLRTLGLESFKDYREYLSQNDGEVENFINSISTNLTKFFRESHHFDHLRKNVAQTFAKRRPADGRLRVWSAGCSTGEEPHTIGMVLKHEIHDIHRHDVKILATDIDTEVVRKASSGIYQMDSLNDVPKEYRQYFSGTGDEGRKASVAVDDAVRQLITFRQLNLLGPWPFKGLFDAIFCRNVMIYFDMPTKTALIDRFIEQIKPGGWLYIGHSESLIGTHPGLKIVGRTIYQRLP